MRKRLGLLAATIALGLAATTAAAVTTEYGPLTQGSSFEVGGYTVTVGPVADGGVVLLVDDGVPTGPDAAAAPAATAPLDAAVLLLDALSHTSAAITPSPDKYTWYVRDYVGLNAASVGYTSLGGDRLDRYGNSYLEITFVTLDGSYVDIHDEQALQNYVVVAQNVRPNTQMSLALRLYSDGTESSIVDFSSIECIDLLVVRRDGTLGGAAVGYTPVEILPSPDKYTHHMRNYVGKNAAACGYTSLGGQRLDAYGDGYLELVLCATDGSYIDIYDTDDLASYVVVSQSVAPNTEIDLVFRTYSDGTESSIVDYMTVEQVVLTIERLAVQNIKTQETPAAQEAPTSQKSQTSVESPAAGKKTVSKNGVDYFVQDDGTLCAFAYQGGAMLNIPSSVNGMDVTAIGASAFEGHSEITSVTMWAKPTYIGESAFRGCTGLDYISVPSSVESIGDHAFEGCTALESVILWGNPNIGSYAFYGCTALDYISIGSGTERIGDHAFEGCTALESVILWGVANIGSYAFCGCTALDYISIPSGTEVIGDHAFDGCTYLETVIIWGRDTQVGEGAFDNCPSLSSYSQL